jgi:hypothetical protein
MPLTQLSVDDGPHNSDGLLLHGSGRNDTCLLSITELEHLGIQ